MTRRTLLIGAGAGAIGVLLASCTPEPKPSPTRSVAPQPTPTGSVPAPASAVRSGWTADPFSRGAVSFTPVGVQPSAREALAEPLGRRVFFAGEATDADDPGTMRGAVRSGVRAAGQVREVAATGERIAVIGAGLAGASVVSRLREAGADVTVFEARDRVGGRIHSVTGDDWPVPVQLGAWLFSAGDAQLQSRLTAVAVTTAQIGQAQWRSPDGVVDPVGGEQVDAALAEAQAAPADESLADALTAVGADPETPELAALLAYRATTGGATAAEASSWFPPAAPSDDRTAALSDLAPLLTESFEGASVSLSSPVSRIAYDDSGVSLRLGTGEALSFDRVVVTVPLGVLQHEGLEFAPPLPFGHRGAVAALGTGSIETVWLRFDEPFWDTEADLWHVVGGDAVVRTWINLRPTTGENVLVGLVGGAAAAGFGELGDAEATAAALAALEPFAAVSASG